MVVTRGRGRGIKHSPLHSCPWHSAIAFRHELWILSRSTPFQLSLPCLQLCVTELGRPRFLFPCSILSSVFLTICLETLECVTNRVPLTMLYRSAFPVSTSWYINILLFAYILYSYMSTNLTLIRNTFNFTINVNFCDCFTNCSGARVAQALARLEVMSFSYSRSHLLSLLCANYSQTLLALRYGSSNLDCM